MCLAGPRSWTLFIACSAECHLICEVSTTIGAAGSCFPEAFGCGPRRPCLGEGSDSSVKMPSCKRVCTGRGCRGELEGVLRGEKSRAVALLSPSSFSSVLLGNLIADFVTPIVRSNFAALVVRSNFAAPIVRFVVAPLRALMRRGEASRASMLSGAGTGGAGGAGGGGRGCSGNRWLCGGDCASGSGCVSSPTGEEADLCTSRSFAFSRREISSFASRTRAKAGSRAPASTPKLAKSSLLKRSPFSRCFLEPLLPRLAITESRSVTIWLSSILDVWLHGPMPRDPWSAANLGSSGNTRAPFAKFKSPGARNRFWLKCAVILRGWAGGQYPAAAPFTVKTEGGGGRGAPTHASCSSSISCVGGPGKRLRDVLA